MKCEEIVELAQSGETAVLEEIERQHATDHVSGCRTCQDAIRAMDALRWLKDRPVEPSSDDLFRRTLGAITDSPATRRRRSAFWLGTGVGGAVAASFFALALSLGFFGVPVDQGSATAEFLVSMDETRNLNIAIDASSDLVDAEVSVSFYGGIEMDGYTQQRHLSWQTDLAAGVNKLSLPIKALDDTGGQIIVRLEHPKSRQEFLVNLRHDG